MPPPPPDRRDYLYREGRRHDSGGGGEPLPPPPAPTPPRWRDSPYHPPPPPPLRDHARPSPRRAPSSVSSGTPTPRKSSDLRRQLPPSPRPPSSAPLISPNRSAISEGYYRQGGGAYDRSYPDEMPLGYTPSRSERYWMDDEGGGGYKGFSRYGGGGGRRDGRDMRGSYRRSPFRSYGSDFSRNHQEQPPPPPPRRSPLRSVAVPICYDSPGNRVDRGDRDNLPRVTPWRRRESRSEAAGAAGSGHGSAGQSTRPAASEKEASAHPPAVTSPHGADEEAPRKKARLGWGQGLAKYEKQKVQVPTDPAEVVADWSSADAGQKAVSPPPVLRASPVAGPSPAPAPPPCTSPVAVPLPPPPPPRCASPVAAPPPPRCTSPVAAPPPPPPPGPLRCASPVAAPSPPPAPPRCASPVVAVPSIAPAPPRCASPVAVPSPAPPYCSSAAAPEDKSCQLTANTVMNSSQDAPGADQACNDEFPIKLDHLGDDPIDSLANLLAKFLQNDSSSGDSKGLTSTSKLLVLKESISKEIEKTELEIDSLEGELKSVDTEAGTAVEDSPTGVTYTENVSPSSGTSKVPGSTKICDKSLVKGPSETSPCLKTPAVQANAKDAEMMEIETAPVHNAKTASEESAACPEVAKGQACAAADVGRTNPSEGAIPQIDADNEKLEASSCHVDTSSVKLDVSGDLPGRQCFYPSPEYNLLGSLTSANNDIAKVANESVFKSLPADTPLPDLLASSHVSSQRNNDLTIKVRLALHKNRLRFKEQALTFKFRALRYLWKEDVRLLSARKQRSKSNKRIDQSSRTSQIGSQRQRAYNRSRLAMPAGNLSTFLTPEISDVANKLFSEFHIKRCRNYLKMPALILDEKEKECLRFVSKNGLVEDPVAVEKERVMINPWTQEEKEIFMEMLAKFGKNFSKISSFLTHKTTADCVEFYYKHHKSDSFREVKKLLDLRHQQHPTSNYLGAKSGKKWNREANAASLDMLGVASAVAAQSLEYENGVDKISAKSLIRNGSNVSFVARKSYKECLDNVSLHERESVAADVLAGICGTLSPEGMSSCITSSADPGQKISIARVEQALTPEIDRSVDDEDTLSDQECEVDPVDWNDDEKSIFIEAMNNYGKDFARISSCVKSKSYEQCKVFFSKARKSLGLDLIHQGVADISMPTSDTNGGRSDTDEACAAEMDSAICSPQSFAKTEMDVCTTERAIQGPISCVISKKIEGDGSKFDCDVLDVKTEEGENKADKTCDLADHERFSEEAHRSTCGPIDINCPETAEKLDGTDDTVDQMSMHNSSAISSATEQAVSVHLEARIDGCSHKSLDNILVKAESSGPSASIVADTGLKENVHFSKVSGATSTSPTSISSYQHSMPGGIAPSKPKPQVTPLTPKDLMPVQFSSVLPDPTSIRFEGIASITTPSFEDNGNRICNGLGAKDMNKYPAFKDESGNRHDTLFRNIDGYTNHLTTESSFFSERNASGTVSTSQPDRFTVTKFQNGRSSSLGLPNSTDGIQWTRKHNEVLDGSLRPCSRNTSSEGNEQVKRPGDVKLFGQILSQQSSLQSSGSSCNGSKSKPSSPKVDISPMRLLNNPRDRVACSSRPAVPAHLGPEDRSVRSYGHLDGSTAQPEHLLVMAKCQTSLAGVPFYSAKNGTLGVFSDYQQPLMQAQQSDPKRLERYSDPQKRNGMDFMSGFQQPGKVTRFGGTGILVSGVSDPVAALKAQYGPGSKIMSSDVDPWKDIGSR
ncbi:hypothetical protein EJB05_34159, partial [Eragrostis curvula]